MASNFLLCLLLLLLSTQLTPTLAQRQTQINSNSVLVALLDSHYTELAELVEKALLLQTLEQSVAAHNITIFAPRNEALERDLDPEFKRFLLEPRNLKSLQTLLLHHILPRKINWPDSDSDSPTESTRHHTLSADSVEIGGVNSELKVVRPNDVVRADGVIHGIEGLLIPKSVQQEFNRRRSLESISAVKPESAPVVDPRTHRLKKPSPPVPVVRLRFSRFTTPWHPSLIGSGHRLLVPVDPTTTSTARPR